MLTFEIRNTEGAVTRLKKIPERLKPALIKTIEERTLAVLNLAKEKVSGPVLKNRTGTLRRKINHRMEVSAHQIIGRVGIRLSYAAAHEFGFKGQGTSDVRAHVRRIKSRNLQGIKGKGGKATGVAFVRAHTRNWNMDLPERSFIRSALRELKESIHMGIADVVGGILG